MSILSVWKKRTRRESPARFLFTAFSVAAVIMLLVATQNVYRTAADSAPNDGDGMFRYFVPLLCGAAMLCSGIHLFLSYYGFLVGNNSQLRLLRTAGATERQLFSCIVADAFLLDGIGALAGCPLGVAAARILIRMSGPTYLLPSATADLTRSVVFALPELVLVPIVILSAAAYFFAPSRNKNGRCHKKKRENRNTLDKRPGLFAAGGHLERSFLQNDKRHSRIILASLTAELAALLLLTGLFFELKSFYIKQDGGTEINITYSASCKTDPMIQTVDRVLTENRQSGRISSMYTEHIYDGLRTFFLTENSEATDAYLNAVQNADRSYEPMMWMFCACDLQQRGQLVHCDIIFLDDDTFRLIARENGIDCGAGEALFYNSCCAYLCKDGTRCQVLQKTPRAMTIYRNNVEIGQDGVRAVNTYYGSDFNTSVFFEEELPNCAKKEILIAGQLKDTATLLEYDLNEHDMPFLLLSQNDEGAFADFMSGVMIWNTALIHTNDHAALSAALLDSVKQFNEYDIRNRRFGVGTEIYGTPMNKDGKGIYQQRDKAQMQLDLDAFQAQFRSFYIFFFGLSAVFMIANVVDIVYLDQKMRFREYAILYSLGLSEKQRSGMRLYESIFYSVRCAALTFVSGCILFVPVYLFLMKGMLFEGLQGVGGALYDLNVPQTIEWVAQKVFSACASAAVFSLLAAIFMFALFAVLGRFYQNNNDMEQLITVLKDET